MLLVRHSLGKGVAKVHAGPHSGFPILKEIAMILLISFTLVTNSKIDTFYASLEIS